MGIRVGVPAEGTAQLFQPFRIDARHSPGEKPRRLNHLCRHDPRAGFTEHRRSGKYHNFPAFCGGVEIFLFEHREIGKDNR